MLEVCHDRVEPGAQLARQRHRPRVLALGATGVDHLGAEVVVVGHDTGDAAAERDHLRTRESGDVDDDVGLGLAGQADAVTEDHAPLGVGVDDLDGRAVAHRHDVTGTLGGAARHVLGEAEVAGDGHRATQFSGGDDRGCNRGGAGHVGLHGEHAAGRLDAQAARVEGDALAHECDGRALGPTSGGGVGHRHDARRVDRALADADDAAEAALGEGLLVEDRDGDLARGCRSDGLDAVDEGLRGEQVRRGVDEVAGEVASGADDGCALDGGLDPLALAERRDDRDLGPTRNRHLLGLGLAPDRRLGGGRIEAVAAGIRTVGDSRESGLVGGRQRHGDRGLRGDRAQGGAGGGAEHVGRDVGGGAESGHDDGGGGHIGHGHDADGLARLGLGLEVGENCGEVLRGGGRQTVAGGERRALVGRNGADDEGVDLEVRGVARGEAEGGHCLHSWRGLGRRDHRPLAEHPSRDRDPGHAIACRHDRSVALSRP
ncbi:hypothetical protein JNB_01335 [Janibacter sp. HTCC2649]|nr:hypothetical protein JNB_01335 [Janibacter sp. HTCC2649]